MSDLRIGMVGAGGIARSRHVPGLKAIDGVRLEAVANRSRESSERAAAEFGFARAHAHWRDVVRDPEVDAVVIGAWPYLHAPIALAALEAGKHVLIEARLAMNAVEGRDILTASRRRPDLVAMVVPAPFSFWADACVQRLLAEGEIGDLRLVRVFWGGGDGPLSVGPAWRCERRYSGNNVLSLGIVYETLARWVGHARWVQADTQLIAPRHAAGPADVPDLVSVLAELPGGARLSLDMSPHARFGGANTVHLFGSAGTIEIDLSHRSITLDQGNGPTEIQPREGERADWRVEAEFVGAIRGAEEVKLTDVATAVRYMEFTDAVHASAAAGRRIPV
jgi:predicted dehydrogenase